MEEISSRGELKKLSQHQKNWPLLEKFIASAVVQDKYSKKMYLISRNISAGFAGIDGVLNELCTLSCSSCRELCCMRATVSYDLKDLLFIYLNTGTFPGSPISRTINGACNKLTHAGCEDKRADRPFICTWYICGDQKEILKSHSGAPSTQHAVEAIQKIQSLRRELENTFFTAISISEAPHQ